MPRFRELIVDYFVNSQFHGLRFLGQKERHWTERLFWLVCICASWYGCFLLMLSSWNSFQNHSLSFGTETTYTDWNTTLFAVTICEESNLDRVFEVAARFYGEDHDYNLDEVLKEITFFKGNSYYIKEFCGTPDLECPKSDFKQITDLCRVPCNETFEYCYWMGVEFDCCEYFQRLETELGPCFSLNSIQTKKRTPFPLISNRVSGPGTLRLELNVPVNVYIHAPEDVPTMNTISTELVQIDPALQKKRVYGVTEIVNDDEVREVSVKQRRCRFPEENYLTVYKHYSYTACVVECRAKEQMRLCNCTSHFTPNAKNKDVCDLAGLQCLNSNFAEYGVVVNKGAQKKGVVCSCLPGCSEPEYDLIEHEEFGINDLVSVAELSLGSLATLRYKRRVVRGRLDLVGCDCTDGAWSPGACFCYQVGLFLVAVSLGGTVGLFVGASLLSFVEFLYFFSIRICCRPKKNMKKLSQFASEYKGGGAGKKSEPFPRFGPMHQPPYYVSPPKPVAFYM